MEDKKTISPDVTKPLLERGWVVISHSEANERTFYFRQIRFEENEVERTITETEIVAVMDNL